jgi:hypothetical protein
MNPKNPKQTIAYLDELQVLGFTDEAFRRLHHMSRKAAINTHRSYCERIGSFLDDRANERVQKRLEIVLTCYKAYHAGNPAIFPQLADAAYCLVPTLPS